MALSPGCHHGSSEPASAAHGQSSYQFVTPPSLPTGRKDGTLDDPTEERKPRDFFVEAKPEGVLPNPEYPTVAVTAMRWPVTIGMRITIDESGRVSAVAPSLAVFSLPNEFTKEFQAAVETALAQWKFSPAEIRHLVPLPGPGDYWTAARVEKVESFLDVAFTFTSVGNVQVSPVEHGK